MRASLQRHGRNPIEAVPFAQSCPSISFSPPDPVSSAVCDLIQRCWSLAETKRAHARAAVAGVLRHHLPSAAALLLAYSSHGDSSASLRLFNTALPCQLRGRAFLWNVLVRALSGGGLHAAALSVYNRMLNCGVRPDDRTFPFALAAAAADPAQRKGRELHGSALKVGFLNDLFVGNTLLFFYGTVGDLPSAEQTFEEMSHRDIISWNSIISVFWANGLHYESMRWWLALKRSELSVNSVSLISVLPACAAQQDAAFGMGMHGFAIKVGLTLVVTVNNAFIDMYGKCGDAESATRVFWNMHERNDVSWNSIISTLVHVCRFEDALNMFIYMLSDNEQPNSITVSSLLPALVELECFDLGKEVHCYCLRAGMETDVFVSNSILDMYAKSGYRNKASFIFYQMQNKNTVSWNAMIANLTQNGDEIGAIELVKEMQDCDASPNSVTFTNVLPACARISSLNKGKEIHARTIHAGSIHDLFVSNALIDMYAKCGKLIMARNLFYVSERDQVSYNTLIVSYSESSLCSESLDLFVEMGLVGFKYDAVSFMGVLSACANLIALKQGKEVHCLSIRKMFDTHLFVANSLLDLYMKCGRIDTGRKIFDRMPNRDVASWNSMILGYGTQGELKTAINLFDMMEYESVDYDHVSYIAVLSACSHAGLVERGKRYFDQMLSQNIRPTQMHFACMVDLLGRAGLMKDAANLITSMPFKADSNVWGALLGACRIHGNIEVGRWAAEHLFELKPGHSGYYILLSNIYAEAGRQDEVNEIRELMKSRKVKKSPGYSWVESGNKMRAFLVGEMMGEPDDELRYAESD